MLGKVHCNPGAARHVLARGQAVGLVAGLRL